MTALRSPRLLRSLLIASLLAIACATSMTALRLWVAATPTVATVARNADVAS